MKRTLYKYRSVDNFKYFVDILINLRLYAGSYKFMNDPMEGLYLYDENGALNYDIRNLLYEEKIAQKFCCLSKDKDNFLMWSHYANGHRGVVIGVKISEEDYIVKDIEYINGFSKIDIYNTNTCREILSKKVNYWEYEKEVRVFTKDQSEEIKVEITEIILGSKMNYDDQVLIQDLVKFINPKIPVTINFV